MTPRESIEATIRRMLHAYPIAVQVYGLRVRITTYQDVARTLRQDYADAAEVVDLMGLITEAAVEDILSGSDGFG